MRYNSSTLVQRLKSKGREITEEVVEEMIKEVFDWLTEEAKDKKHLVVSGIVQTLKPYVLELTDKIDGVEDNTKEDNIPF